MKVNARKLRSHILAHGTNKLKLQTGVIRLSAFEDNLTLESGAVLHCQTTIPLETESLYHPEMAIGCDEATALFKQITFSKGDLITVSINDDQIDFFQADFNASCKRVEHLPEQLYAKEIITQPYTGKLLKDITFIQKAMSKNSPHLAGVMFNGSDILAADGQRMHYNNTPKEGELYDQLEALPLKIMMGFLRLEPVSNIGHDRTDHLLCLDGDQITIHAKMCENSISGWYQVIPKSPVIILKLNNNNLSKALTKLKRGETILYADYVLRASHTYDEDQTLQLPATPVTVIKALESTMRVHMNTQHLRDALTDLETTIEFSDPLKPIIIHSRRGYAVVSTMRP